MRLLVTGGTGFIGSRLALEVRARGHALVVAGQLNSDAERIRARELADHGIPIELGRLQDPGFARRITTGCDAIVHLAAAQHEANVADDYFFDVNVNGTRALLDAAKQTGVRRFVFGSTIGVYGESRGNVLDEDTPPKPMNAYGRSKLRAEEVVNSYGHALETCIIRISETYGPGDFRLLKLFRSLSRGRFVIIGSGLNQRQAIYVGDLVTALLLATDSQAAVGETFVMAGEEIMTTREMVAYVANAVGRRPPRWRAPLWPFLAAAIVLENTMTPLGLQPPLHRRRLDFFRKSFIFSSTKARVLLNFTPAVQFAGGVVETAKWYREKGYLSP